MNMKKFLTILILGLAIFAVSCSDNENSNDPTSEELFLEKIKGKSGDLYYGTDIIGAIKFDSTGKIGTITTIDDQIFIINYVSASSSTAAVYADGDDSSYEYNLSTTTTTLFVGAYTFYFAN